MDVVWDQSQALDSNVNNAIILTFANVVFPSKGHISTHLIVLLSLHLQVCFTFFRISLFTFLISAVCLHLLSAAVFAGRPGRRRHRSSGLDSSTTSMALSTGPQGKQI